MQSRTLIAVTVAVLAFAPLGAQARRFPDFYSGVGYGALSYKVGSNGASVPHSDTVEFSPTSLRGIFGFDIGKHMALECLFQVSQSGYTTTRQRFGGRNDDVTYEASLTTAWYLRGTTKLGENLEGFARVGRATTDFKVSVLYDINNQYFNDNREFFSYDYSSPSWGLGVSYALDKRLTVDIDYMDYLDYENKDEVHTLAGTTISLVYQL